MKKTEVSDREIERHAKEPGERDRYLREVVEREGLSTAQVETEYDRARRVTVIKQVE